MPKKGDDQRAPELRDALLLVLDIGGYTALSGNISPEIFHTFISEFYNLGYRVYKRPGLTNRADISLRFVGDAIFIAVIPRTYEYDAIGRLIIALFDYINATTLAFEKLVRKLFYTARRPTASGLALEPNAAFGSSLGLKGAMHFGPVFRFRQEEHNVHEILGDSVNFVFRVCEHVASKNIGRRIVVTQAIVLVLANHQADESRREGLLQQLTGVERAPLSLTVGDGWVVERIMEGGPFTFQGKGGRFEMYSLSRPKEPSPKKGKRRPVTKSRK